MTDAVREARERVTEIAWAPGVRFMGEGARFAEGLDALLAARDAEWREAVERVRASSADAVRPVGAAWARESQASGDGLIGVHSPHLFRLAESCHNAALDALLAATEGA